MSITNERESVRDMNSILHTLNYCLALLLCTVNYFMRVPNSAIHPFSTKSREHKIANAEILS